MVPGEPSDGDKLIRWVPMKIRSVNQAPGLIQVLAEVSGKKIEYTSQGGNAWEVYDFPKSFRGLPRFVGRMPADKGAYIVSILERDGWIGGRFRSLDKGTERVPQRRGPTSEDHPTFNGHGLAGRLANKIAKEITSYRGFRGQAIDDGKTWVVYVSETGVTGKGLGSLTVYDGGKVANDSTMDKAGIRQAIDRAKASIAREQQRGTR